jgi:hypothetical protein
MAMENKRITQLSTERLNLTSGDYVMVDDADNGSAKYRLDRLKETDTTLSVSGKAADAAATGQAISEEAQARTQAVTAETQARQQAITAESQARQAEDTALGNDVDDLKSALEKKIPLSLITGSYVDSNGVFKNDASRSRTGYIYVGDYAILNLSASVDSMYNAFYDENKQYLCSFKVGSDTHILIPANAKYMALSNTTAGMEGLSGGYIPKDDNRISLAKNEDVTIKEIIADTYDYTPPSSVLKYQTNKTLRYDGVAIDSSSSGDAVSDYISIESFNIKSVLCAFPKNSQVAMAFYSAANESSFIASYASPDLSPNPYWQGTNTVPEIPANAKYIRIAGRNDIVSGSPSITLGLYDSKLSIQEIETRMFLKGKNLVGCKKDVFYPVYIKPGDVLTLSTSNSQPSTNHYYIEFFGTDKQTALGYVTMTKGLSERTWTYNLAGIAYFAKWHDVPSDYEIQIEFGSSKTLFEEYFGDSKFNYNVIETLLPKDTIFERCADQIFNIRNISGFNRAVYGTHDFNMLLMSDLHDDLQRMKNAFTLASNNMIDCVANLGDTFGYGPNLDQIYLPQKIAAINMTDKPAFILLGNHDQRVDGVIDVTTKQVVDAFLRETNDGEIYEDNGCFYKDFDDYDIRVIGLNAFDMPDDKEDGAYIYYGSSIMYQQTQITWLIDTLNSVPADYTVIILSHYVEPTLIDNNAIDIHPEFIGASYTSLNWGELGRMSGPVIADIINAYKNKTTISQTYTYSMNGTHQGSVNASADFQSAEGEFACYIVGHTHCHAIGHLVSHPDQVVYFHDSSRATINNSTWTTISSLFSRDTDTKNQDLLTVFSIDTANKLLKFIRIGAHINVFGEDYNVVTYSYDSVS